MAAQEVIREYFRDDPEVDLDRPWMGDGTEDSPWLLLGGPGDLWLLYLRGHRLLALAPAGQRDQVVCELPVRAARWVVEEGASAGASAAEPPGPRAQSPEALL